MILKLEAPSEEPIKHNFFSSQTGVPKHSKVDYEVLNDISVKSILNHSTAERKQ